MLILTKTEDLIDFLLIRNISYHLSYTLHYSEHIKDKINKWLTQ